GSAERHRHCVGSLRARTTEPVRARDSGFRGGVPTREDDGTETGVGPWVQQCGPHARGRRIRHHHQTRPYKTSPRLSWKQPHPRKGRATLMQHIGDRIREDRMLHGLTQEDLAEKAGMHPNTIKKLEQGGTARMDTLHRIARALNTTTDSLISKIGRAHV